MHRVLGVFDIWCLPLMLPILPVVARLSAARCVCRPNKRGERGAMGGGRTESEESESRRSVKTM
jgi:hypothetical protein